MPDFRCAPPGIRLNAVLIKKFAIDDPGPVGTPKLERPLNLYLVEKLAGAFRDGQEYVGDPAEVWGIAVD